MQWYYSIHSGNVLKDNGVKKWKHACERCVFVTNAGETVHQEVALYTLVN